MNLILKLPQVFFLTYFIHGLGIAEDTLKEVGFLD
jgi:hypothetical protein